MAPGFAGSFFVPEQSFKMYCINYSEYNVIKNN
jgi:hypothetical protein